MEPLDVDLSHEELHRQREQIRRSFLRANTAVAIILVAVLGLTMAAVLEGLRAARDRLRAEAAEQDGREKLWRSYLAQVRAGRLSGLMGHRTEGLETIRTAAAIRPALELRNEALACLALTDLEEDGPRWALPADTRLHTFDAALVRYALSGPGSAISIRRLADNTELLSLRGVAAGVPEGRMARAYEFSPDGRYFAARFGGGAVVVWDLTNARPVFTSALGCATNIVGRPKFIERGRLVAFANAERDGRLSVFDHLTGREERLTPVIDGRRPFAFQPGRRVIAVAEGKESVLWDWQTGERLRTLSQEAEVAGLMWDTQGRRLACAGRYADVTLWDMATGASRLLSGHGTSAWYLNFSQDGTMLLTASLDGLTRLWDTERGRLLCSTDRGYGVTFSPDDNRIGFEQPAKAVGVWRVQRGPIYRTLSAPEMRDKMVWNQDLTADGRWLTWACFGELRLWDLTSTKPPLILPLEDLRSVGFHPQKPSLILCRTQAVELRPLQAAAPEATPAAQLGPAQSVPLPRGARPREFAISPNGRTLAVEGNGRRVVVLDLEKPGRFVFLDTRSSSFSIQGPGSGTGSGHMALSPDGRWIAIGFGQGVPAPQVWDTRDGKLVQRLATDIAAVAFSADGRWLVTGSAAEYVLWSVGDWRAIWRLPREGMALAPGAAAFTCDGSWLAVASSRQRVQVLDRATGTELASLASPDPLTVTGLRLPADGSLLAVATPQGAFQIWDLQRARRELAALQLDWAPASAPATAPLPHSRSRPSWSGPGEAIGAGLMVVAAVALVVLLVLRRHRRLIEDFARTEMLAARRNRQLEMARVELMHGQKMKALGTLAAGIAHDFNNLLSVVRMSNKLIGREVPHHPEVREHVATVEQAVQQGKHVVRSMLGYSREAPDDGSPQDVSEIVEETVALLSKEFLSGIQLTLELNRQTPPVPASRGRLEQILLNLVVNAAEAMKGQGKLRISVGVTRAATDRACLVRPKPAAQHVELAVADSGPGIDPRILPRIFEPFFTTKVTGATRGTGLGLSMVYTIAEQDGLGLGVETEPGQGAKFRVIIPAA